jgi:hypothetical protein
VRSIVRDLPDVARACGAQIRLVQDAGSFVRAAVSLPGHTLELDLVHEAVADIEPPPPPVEGIVVVTFDQLENLASNDDARQASTPRADPALR